MSAMHCPTCAQQVAPGMRCWSCGTPIPRSLGRIMANIGACLVPFAFCVLFGGAQAYFIKVEEDRRQKAEAEKRAAAEKAANPPALPRGPAPKVPWGTFYAVQFDTTEGPSSFGVAFVAEAEDGPVLLTSRFLLTLPNGEILPPPMVNGSRLDHPFDRRAKALQAGPGYGVIAGHDVIALPTPKGVGWVDVLPLAEEIPPPGTPLWLATTARDPEARLIPVVAGQVGAGKLVYRFEDAGTKLRQEETFGAPIVNGEGEIVGMHIAGVRRDGRLLGAAAPAAKFASPLRRARARLETPKKTR